MVAKLVAIYAQPENPAEFEDKYFNTHLPLAKKMPGLLDAEVIKFKKKLAGECDAPYMMATLSFESLDALKAALASPEGQAAGANIMGIAGKIIQLYSTETVEAPAGVAAV